MKEPSLFAKALPCLALAAVAGATACGSSRSARAPHQEPALLYFTNESLDQADVYAVISGSRSMRIGTVQAGRTDTLVIPANITSYASNVSVFARLLARSARPTTGPIPLRPGDHFVLRLPIDQKMIVVLPADP
jgi:hypothetical protein